MSSIWKRFLGEFYAWYLLNNMHDYVTVIYRRVQTRIGIRPVTLPYHNQYRVTSGSNIKIQEQMKPKEIAVPCHKRRPNDRESVRRPHSAMLGKPGTYSNFTNGSNFTTSIQVVLHNRLQLRKWDSNVLRKLEMGSLHWNDERHYKFQKLLCTQVCKGHWSLGVCWMAKHSDRD